MGDEIFSDSFDEMDGVSPLFQKGLAVKAAESLTVIKEDLSEWLSQLLKVDITAETFLNVLDTGVVLCRLVGAVQEHVEGLKKEGKFEQPKLEQPVPMTPVKCKEMAEHGSFFARDNTANFISWCRKYKIEEAVLFESDDLVSHKDEKSVILTLLEVAKQVAKLGMQTTQLAMMDISIDNEEDFKEPTPPPKSPPGAKTKTTPAGGIKETSPSPKVSGDAKTPPAKKKRPPTNLVDSVIKVINECNCSSQIQVEHHGKGKFRLSRQGRDHILFAREAAKKVGSYEFLRDKIMVRVGGGWDTLDHFLLKHDPCRIKGLKIVE